MSIPFSSFFGLGLMGAGRAAQFLQGVDRATRANGIFGAGQPFREPYVQQDGETGEAVVLWRTADDEYNQLRYQQYREVKRRGLGEAMKRVYPELFAPNERHKREQPVRAYDYLTRLTAALSALVNGKGVDIKTGVTEMDRYVQVLNLEEKVKHWTVEASIFGRVGLEVVIDQQSLALDVVRVLPDHLYIHRAPDNDDEINCIAKRYWMRLQAVPKWEPLVLQTRSRQGLTGIPASNMALQTGLSGDLSAPSRLHRDGVLNVKQDGFVYEERHYKGWVERSFYATAGNRIIGPVPLEFYDRELAKRPVQFTGMNDFAIVLFDNTGEDGTARSDWDNIFNETLDYNRRATLLGRLVDRYSSPKELVPASMIQTDPVTGRAQWGMGDSDAIVIRPTDQTKPEFLQPNPSFEGPISDLEDIRSNLGVISTARHVFDPEVLGQSNSGTALMLMMHPTLSHVMPRRTSQERAVRQLLMNILCAVEFHSQKPAADPQSSYVFDSLALGNAGALAPTVAKLLRQKNLQGGSYRVSIASFARTFRNVFTDAALDRQAETMTPEEVEARDFFLRPDMDSGLVMGPDGNPAQAPKQVGQNHLDARPLPEPAVRGSELQRVSDAAAVCGCLLELDTVKVRFRPGTPQDASEARAAVAEGVMSLERYLTEVEGLTEDEAEEEIQLIRGAVENLPGEAFGAGGEARPEDPMDSSQQQIQADGMALAEAQRRWEASRGRGAPSSMDMGGDLPTDFVQI